VLPPALIRSFVVIGLLFTPLCSAARPAARLETVPIHGDRYVPIKGWAESKGFSFGWDVPSKAVTASNRWARLSFVVNSKKASINGLNVWLSSAVIPNGNGVYLAERDLQKLILPILYPEKLPVGKKIKTIAVAAGHGGKDPGYQINRQQEKKFTLLMAKALKDALTAAGFKVIMTRETDVFVDLEEQAARANRAKADLFITLHYNAAAEIDAKGLETYCLTPAGAISTNGGSPMGRSPGHKQDSLNSLLAYQLHRSLIQNAGLEDRGIRRAGFVVLRNITMPGVLIEGGFLSNPGDAEKICSANDRRTAARAIVDGIMSFKRLVERK
jgi:N-acetylmuramoyl-L-alanine amidase